MSNSLYKKADAERAKARMYEEMNRREELQEELKQNEENIAHWRSKSQQTGFFDFLGMVIVGAVLFYGAKHFL